MLEVKKQDARNRQLYGGKQITISLKFQKSDAAVLYSTLLYSALLYTTVLFSILYSSLLFSTLLFRIGPALLPEQEQEQEQTQKQEQEQEQEQDQNQKQEQGQEEDVLLWNYFSTNIFVFLM